MVSTMTGVEKVKIPEGYKQTEVGVIPEDWQVVQVQDVCGFIVPGRNKPEKFDGDIPWITTPDLTDGRIVYHSGSGLKISKEEAKSVGSKIVPQNSVIMSCVGELGIVAIAGCNMVLNQQLHAFLPSSKINSFYLAYSLKTQEKYFYSAATKTALPYLNKDNCNATPLVLPNIKEQTAIANALSDVDNLIASLETLVAKKSAIKTAAMQQLLTGKKRLPAFVKESEKQSSELDNTSETAQATQTKQTSTLNSDLYKKPSEGLDTKSNQHSDVGNANNKQTAPRPGYKQTELGEIPEDWEVRVLGESLSIMHGRDQKQVECADGKFPILGTGGEMGRTDSYLYNKPSVLIGRKGSINKPRYMDSPFWTVDTLFYSQVSEKFNAKFIFYKFCMIDWMSYNEASGVPSLNSSTIESVMQVFPETREEQTAIANVLSDMDTELEALQQRLNKTKTIKQGMMQELLTGKTRLV
mgnify:CR=1 FL=1